MNGPNCANRNMRGIINKARPALMTLLTMAAISCDTNGKKTPSTVEKEVSKQSEKLVKLMTLDPGHFHAYLVQKSMYDEVDSIVHVYAPDGQEVIDHISSIEQFNNRKEDPTSWQTKVYKGEDYLQKMLVEKPGNVMMVAGNNAKKTRYIYEAVSAGINVLADKPMVILPKDLGLLQEAYKLAESKGLLIYDIMTERFEITTMMQKRLAQLPELFGDLEKGNPGNPAISKESVHHFYKYVAGKPLKRPAWFFDIKQEGAGIVDVSTHLVDLILWECFPDEAIFQKDVEVTSAKQWATSLTKEEFENVTGNSEFPSYLADYVNNNKLEVKSNGEFVFKTKGVYGKVSVIWNYQAPEGAKDTHFSMMRGTKANLVIRQDKAQNYIPTLYIEPIEGTGIKAFEEVVLKAVKDISKEYPGLSVKPSTNGWELEIPNELRLGHEAHFKQVTENYLDYLEKGKLPDWEVQNILTKYFITMEAYKKSLYSNSN